MRARGAGRAGGAGILAIALAAGAALAAQQPPAQTPLQRVQASIERTTRSVNATWGIYVKSLDTGEEIAIAQTLTLQGGRIAGLQD